MTVNIAAGPSCCACCWASHSSKASRFYPRVIRLIGQLAAQLDQSVPPAGLRDGQRRRRICLARPSGAFSCNVEYAVKFDGDEGQRPFAGASQSQPRRIGVGRPPCGGSVTHSRRSNDRARTKAPAEEFTHYLSGGFQSGAVA